MSIVRYPRRALALLTAAFIVGGLVGPLPTVSAQGRPRQSTDFANAMSSMDADDTYGAFIHFVPGRETEGASLLRSSQLRVVTTFKRASAVFARGSVSAFRALTDEASIQYLEANQRIALVAETAPWATRARVAQQAASGGPYFDGSGNVLDGSGVGVAVIDSGVNALHPDFEGQMAANYEVTGGNIVESPNSDAVGGHGTHVAGIVAGNGAMSEGTFRGVAPGAHLIGYGAGDGATINMLNAAASFEHLVDYQKEFNIRAVNNSYGNWGTPYDPNGILSKQIKAAIAAGISVIFAAANGDTADLTDGGGTGTDDRTSSDCKNPTPGVICVANYDDGATGSRNDALDASSSRGLAGSTATYPDVSAPGSAITAACLQTVQPVCAGFETRWQPWYAQLWGTSMAAPHVAGVAAMLYQARPDLTPANVEDLLLDTAYKFTSGAAYEPDPQNPDGTTSFDKGAGLVDVQAALEALGTPSAGVGEASTTVFTSDGGDYPGPGAADISSISTVAEEGGIRYTVGVRDVDNAPVPVSFRLFQNVDGHALQTNISVSASGVTPGAETAANMHTQAVATEVTRDVAANTVSFLLPYTELGSQDGQLPAQNSPVHNVNVYSYVQTIADIAPGGLGPQFVTQPEFGSSFTARPAPIVHPTPTVFPTPDPSGSGDPGDPGSSAPSCEGVTDTSALPESTYYFHRSGQPGSEVNEVDSLTAGATFDKTAPTASRPASSFDVPLIGADTAAPPDKAVDAAWGGTIDGKIRCITFDLYQKNPLGEGFFGTADYEAYLYVGDQRYQLANLTAEGSGEPITHIRVTVDSILVADGTDADTAPDVAPMSIDAAGQSVGIQLRDYWLFGPSTILYDSTDYPSHVVINEGITVEEEMTPAPTSVTFTDTAEGGQHGDAATFSAVLRDEDGNGLAGKQLTFELTGEDGRSTQWTGETGLDGLASSIRILSEDAGVYDLTVRFEADEVSLSASADHMVFLIDPEATLTSLDVSGKGARRQLTATLLEEDGVPLGDREIVFFADGAEIARGRTAGDGRVTVAAPQGYRGDHFTFEATYAGERNFAASSGSYQT